jgi:hypothetical protein
MQHTMTMYVADKQQNAFMSAVDMRHESKWFIKKTEVSFNTSTEVNDGYFINLIEKSKKVFSDKCFWIPAISYMGNFYFHPSVKILSDGKQEMFIKATQPSTKA